MLLCWLHVECTTPVFSLTVKNWLIDWLIDIFNWCSMLYSRIFHFNVHDVSQRYGGTKNKPALGGLVTVPRVLDDWEGPSFSWTWTHRYHILQKAQQSKCCTGMLTLKDTDGLKCYRECLLISAIKMLSIRPTLDFKLLLNCISFLYMRYCQGVLLPVF